MTMLRAVGLQPELLLAMKQLQDSCQRFIDAAQGDSYSEFCDALKEYIGAMGRVGEVWAFTLDRPRTARKRG